MYTSRENKYYTKEEGRDMETFIRKTKDLSLQTSIDVLQNDIERAKVIGVGEESHGETVSWIWRYAIINRLIHSGYKVIVMCEQNDGSLQNHNGNDYKNSTATFRSGNVGAMRMETFFILL